MTNNTTAPTSHDIITAETTCDEDTIDRTELYLAEAYALINDVAALYGAMNARMESSGLEGVDLPLLKDSMRGGEQAFNKARKLLKQRSLANVVRAVGHLRLATAYLTPASYEAA